MAIIAEWRKDTYSNFKKCDAQKVYDELRVIGKNNPLESVSNQEFVDYARANPQSESHKLFEWNDSIAAEAYRRSTAKNAKNALITYELDCPQVSITDSNDRKIEIPLFINPGDDSLNAHAPTEIVMQKQDLRISALHKALDELNSFSKRYHYLSELNNVFIAIQQAIQTLGNP